LPMVRDCWWTKMVIEKMEKEGCFWLVGWSRRTIIVEQSEVRHFVTHDGKTTGRRRLVGTTIGAHGRMDHGRNCWTADADGTEMWRLLEEKTKKKTMAMAADRRWCAICVLLASCYSRCYFNRIRVVSTHLLSDSEWEMSLMSQEKSGRRCRKEEGRNGIMMIIPLLAKCRS
jgi:hypothetical protein